MSAMKVSAPLTTLAAAGSIALTFGALFYVFGRSSAALFVPEGLHFPVLAGDGPMEVWGWLPTFLHVLGFSLLTIVIAGRAVILAPVTWALVNIAFEFGQHPSIADRLATTLLPLRQYGRYAATLPDYFLRGTFDAADVLAAAVGAAVASGLSLYFMRKASDEDP
jgi:hypothetical protein